MKKKSVTVLLKGEEAQEIEDLQKNGGKLTFIFAKMWRENKKEILKQYKVR